jgi:hypothetical protein
MRTNRPLSLGFCSGGPTSGPSANPTPMRRGSPQCLSCQTGPNDQGQSAVGWRGRSATPVNHGVAFAQHAYLAPPADLSRGSAHSNHMRAGRSRLRGGVAFQRVARARVSPYFFFEPTLCLLFVFVVPAHDRWPRLRIGHDDVSRIDRPSAAGEALPHSPGPATTKGKLLQIWRLRLADCVCSGVGLLPAHGPRSCVLPWNTAQPEP